VRAIIGKLLSTIFGRIICFVILWIIIGLAIRFYGAFLADFLNPIVAACVGVAVLFGWMVYGLIQSEMNDSEDKN
tara:strand:+ start:391 stop:615 length:225 start_codon:yes stop_codon:yes gene_type:complete